MKVILKNELSLEILQNIFHSEGYSAEITEYLSAAPNLNLHRDAILKVVFPGCPSVIVWDDIYANSQLRMRVVVISCEARDQFDKDELIRDADNINQQIEYFGTLSPNNLLGITLEYRLPYAPGVLEGTILQAATEMARGGSAAKKYLEELLSFKR